MEFVIVSVGLVGAVYSTHTEVLRPQYLWLHIEHSLSAKVSIEDIIHGDSIKRKPNFCFI